MKEVEIKQRLMSLVKGNLREKVAAQKKAMDDAQRDANQHKGAMSSRYDTFKEEAQALRDGFAVQVQRTSDTLAAMEQIILRKSLCIEPGAVVVTEDDAFFVSTGLVDEPLEVDGVKYECVSPSAPVILKLRKAGPGGSVTMGGRTLRVVSVF